MYYVKQKKMLANVFQYAFIYIFLLKTIHVYASMCTKYLLTDYIRSKPSSSKQEGELGGWEAGGCRLLVS